MNAALLLTTVFASAADSLNPVAITQQFVLQGLVKRRHHICYFIAATFVTNFICGMLAYYGLLTVLSNVWDSVYGFFGKSIFVVGVLAGGALIALSVRSILRYRRSKGDKQTEESAIPEPARFKSVHPTALFLLGVSATILELTSALPYFAFIGLLVNYQLSWLEVSAIQLLYNLIYASPLILMYVVYCRKQALFDRAYGLVSKKMEKVAAFVMPALLSIVAVVVLWSSVSSLVAA